LALQYGAAIRNAQLDTIESDLGPSAVLRIRTGGVPVDCAAADSGTVLVVMTLPSDWMAAAASGAKAKAGTWQAACEDAAGTAGHFRIYDNGWTVCGIQGTITMPVLLTTNALTAVNGNVLNFASTTGAVVGMNLSGTGIPAATTAVAVTATTITMSRTSTAGVANTTEITLGGDIVLDNTSIALGQVITVSSFTLTAGNA
jgi:hypothetical protein